MYHDLQFIEPYLTKRLISSQLHFKSVVVFLVVRTTDYALLQTWHTSDPLIKIAPKLAPKTAHLHQLEITLHTYLFTF